MHNHKFLNTYCICCYYSRSTFNSFFFSEFINFKGNNDYSQYNLSSKPFEFTSNNYLNIYYQNVGGLRTKLLFLHANVALLIYDAFILTETWLTEAISNAELGLEGYTIFRCDWNVNTSLNRCGCGVLIAAKNELHLALISSPCVDVEHIFISISTSNGLTGLLGSVYLPPNSDLLKYESHTVYIDQVWLSSIYDFGIFCGDFNLPHVNWVNINSGLKYTGSVTDKVRLVGAYYINTTYYILIKRITFLIVLKPFSN